MNEKDLQELMPLLAKRIEKYTSKESSSIPYEKARQLMGSILYCIQTANVNSQTDSNSLSTSTSTLEESFQMGLLQIKQLTTATKLQYEDIQRSFKDYGNICYYDTIIKGMPAFFTHYDPEFDAENELLTLDYPLLYPLGQQRGIIRIKDYLTHIQLEQQFLSVFPNAEIEEILEGYDDNCDQLIINIASIVLGNALGCVLLNRSISPLYINAYERNHLRVWWRSLSTDQQKESLKSALMDLITENYNGDQILYQYLSTHLNALAAEFQLCASNNCMERLFIAKRSKSANPVILFDDGISMSDESLRELIEELKECCNFSEKLILIKENAKSLSDLKELLAECFYDEEYGGIFQLLTQEERHVLKEDIMDKINFDQDLYDWEQALLLFKDMK